jgi:signal peptidase I
MIEEAHLQSACCDLVADVARNQGRVQLKVGGASMVPTLWPGDLVTVRRCDPSRLRPGSIIVFRQNERLVVHRLVRRQSSAHGVEDCLIAQGDAQPRCDRPVEAWDVLGRVEGAVRNGRPVNLQPSLWRRFLASIFRRSEWCASIYLRLSSRVQRLGFSEATFEH